jgi:small-conductance mechanosensitive channel
MLEWPRAAAVRAAFMLALVSLIVARVHAAPSPVGNRLSVIATPAGAPVASSASPTQGATTVASPPPIPATLERADIIAYLGQAISWYRSLATQARLAQEPDEELFVADNQRMADQALKFAFDFAHAAAALLQDQPGVATSSADASSGPQAQPEALDNDPVRADLQRRRAQVQHAIDQLQAQLNDRRVRLISTKRAERDALTRETIALQAQINLAQSRLESLDAMVDFEKDTDAIHASGVGIAAQIDQLEGSVPHATSGDRPQLAIASAPSAPAPGLLTSTELLLGIKAKQQTLATATESANNLARSAAQLRRTLLAMLTEVDRQGLAQAAHAGDSDLDTIKQTKAEFETLTRRSKSLSDATLPLSKQIVVLELYAANLARWRVSVRQQFHDASRALIVRVASLATLLVALLIASSMWRRLTFRYVEEPQRRHQLLQLRRVVVIVVVALVLLFGFASELGSLATIMGFAAAGIALALQNAIISLVGYFYLSGRFGVRVGDRVQLFGTTGDVLETSFFKITLMELVGGDDRGLQPSGRAVFFPNSVVFLPNCNFSRQLPGTNFSWNELRLTLPSGSDYRLAEKRVGEIVNEVFARYRDTVQREYRAMEQLLNIRAEAPRPQTRLQLGATGLEMIIRYPVRLATALQTADEIARRLTDAIDREPGLLSLTSGNATLLKTTASNPSATTVASPETPAVTPAETAARLSADVPSKS